MRVYLGFQPVPGSLSKIKYAFDFVLNPRHQDSNFLLFYVSLGFCGFPAVV
jgi:hypothetical protein